MRVLVAKSSATCGDAKGAVMSRIGKKPIAVPSGVTVNLSPTEVRVKGPKGELSIEMADLVAASLDGETLTFTRTTESKTARANHGRMRAMAANLIHGVTAGFSKVLVVDGIGYRADVRGKNLVLNLGYSHLIEYAIPAGVDISVDRDNKVTITGADKQQVGQVAAKIRSFRKPDRYKGKGVRYDGEHILLKAGKSA